MEKTEILRRFEMVGRCANALQCQRKMLEEAKEKGRVAEIGGMMEITISCKNLGRGKQKIYLPLHRITEPYGATESAAQMVSMMDRGICSLCSARKGLK